MPKQAIIIGAGPAGLTAANELLKRTDIISNILEKSGDLGGISKSNIYKGNRMNIRGHHFFSNSDGVMNWCLNILALRKAGEESTEQEYHEENFATQEELKSTPQLQPSF